MNKPIRTYDDLVARRQQLEKLLETQKELIHYELKELAEGLEPIRKSISTLHKFLTRDHSNIFLSSGANSLIDLVVKKGILSRSGWLTRLLVPIFLKNYSSNLIAKNKPRWMEKLFSWIGPKHHNGKQEEPAEEDNDQENLR